MSLRSAWAKCQAIKTNPLTKGLLQKSSLHRPFSSSALRSFGLINSPSFIPLWGREGSCCPGSPWILMISMPSFPQLLDCRYPYHCVWFSNSLRLGFICYLIAECVFETGSIHYVAKAPLYLCVCACTHVEDRVSSVTSYVTWRLLLRTGTGIAATHHRVC